MHADSPPSLRIGGITPLSTVDWPGQLAAVVFLQGCPWRCGYCHNGHLQEVADAPAHDWQELATLLAQRRGLLDGVVFSGGEPTAQPDLARALLQVRAMGYACALHTAGIYPRRLAEVLPLVDWVALDVKALPDGYDALTGVEGSRQKADEALNLLLRSGHDFECRTTVDWSILPPADLVLLGERLAGLGVRTFSVQIARPVGRHYRPGGDPHGAQAVLDYLDTLFPAFTVRG